MVWPPQQARLASCAAQHHLHLNPKVQRKGGGRRRRGDARPMPSTTFLCQTRQLSGRGQNLVVVFVVLVVVAASIGRIPPSLAAAAADASAAAAAAARQRQSHADFTSILPGWSIRQQQQQQSEATAPASASSKKNPTIVSGYGSSRHKQAGTVGYAGAATSSTTTITTAGGRPQVTTAAVDAPLLYIQPVSRPAKTAAAAGATTTTTNELRVYSVARNATVALTAAAAAACVVDGAAAPMQRRQQQQLSQQLKINATILLRQQPHHHHRHPTVGRAYDLTTIGWIPVEGLFGVYSLPSGLVYVWIAKSQPIYTVSLPPPPPPPPSGGGTADWKVAEHNDCCCWQIRRVTELHLTRVVADSTTTNSGSSSSRTTSSSGSVQLTRAQRQEEKRQLALLRQALKGHDWFYCTGGDLIPDMTRNLQSCLLSAATTTTTTTTTASSAKPIPLPPPSTGSNETAAAADDDSDNTALDAVAVDHDGKADENVVDDVGELDNEPQDTMLSTISRRRWWERVSSDDNISGTTNQQRRPDSRFFWNEAVVEPMVQQAQITDNTATSEALRILLEHVIPVTSAFCAVRANLSTTNDNNDASQTAATTAIRYDEVLISRRSRFRAGTRFTKRGADATGAVANYAETEQLLFIWQQQQEQQHQHASKTQPELKAVMSHVQTRGSIPLRWSSPTDIKTYRPRIRIGTDPLAQARAVRQHLIDQAAHYVILPNEENVAVRRAERLSRNQRHPKLLFVNLVDKTSDQGRLGRALDAVLTAVLDVHSPDADPALLWLHPAFIEHLWFDFHAEVKSGRWDKLVGLLNQVKPSLADHGYFLAVPTAISSAANKTRVHLRVERLQTGVVRTNCMDCLDRTNVVQSIFGRYMLFQQLADFKASRIPLPFKAAFRKVPMTLPWVAGEVAHRLLWADNADAISRLYAGTPALKGDFTRTGKRTKMGALDDGMNSLQRYYLNNFLDADRQEGVDLLTGHESFSNVDELDIDDLGDESSTHTTTRRTGMSVQEAARRMLLGTCDEHEADESDRNHIRIKVKRPQLLRDMCFEGGSSSVVRRQRSLDLRWLPGDLQSQVRDLISLSDNPADDFKSRDFLQAMGDRAASDMPWWVVADSSDDWDYQGSSSTANLAAVYEAEAAASNNPGYLLGAFVAGTQAPLAMAAVVMGLVAAASSFPLANLESKKKDP